MRSAYASKRKNSTNAKIIICVGFCVQNVLDFPLDHLYALNIAFSRNSELRLTTFCTWSLSILQQWTAASLRSPPANAALLPPRRSQETTILVPSQTKQFVYLTNHGRRRSTTRKGMSNERIRDAMCTKNSLVIF